MQQSPKYPQPLWFPVGHKHPGLIRNRVTPTGGAARKEAVFTTDTQPFLLLQLMEESKVGMHLKTADTVGMLAPLCNNVG